VLQDNIFSTVPADRYIADAILVDGTDYSALGLGTLSSDVYIVSSDSDHTTYSDYFNDTDYFGNAAANSSALYQSVTALGGYLSDHDSDSSTADALVIVTSATTGEDVIFDTSSPIA